MRPSEFHIIRYWIEWLLGIPIWHHYHSADCWASLWQLFIAQGELGQVGTTVIVLVLSNNVVVALAAGGRVTYAFCNQIVKRLLRSPTYHDKGEPLPIQGLLFPKINQSLKESE